MSKEENVASFATNVSFNILLYFPRAVDLSISVWPVETGVWYLIRCYAAVIVTAAAVRCTGSMLLQSTCHDWRREKPTEWNHGKIMPGIRRCACRVYRLADIFTASLTNPSAITVPPTAVQWTICRTDLSSYGICASRKLQIRNDGGKNPRRFRATRVGISVELDLARRCRLKKFRTR